MSLERIFLKVKLLPVCALSSLCCSLWGEPLSSLKLPFKYWNTVMRSHLSFLQAEETWLLHSFLTGQSLQPFEHRCHSPLDPVQYVHVFLALWGTESYMLLQVQPDRCWVEWNDHICTLACNVLCNPQDSIYLCSSSSTLVSCVQLIVPQILFSKAAHQPHRSCSILVS